MGSLVPRIIVVFVNTVDDWPVQLIGKLLIRGGLFVGAPAYIIPNFEEFQEATECRW